MGRQSRSKPPAIGEQVRGWYALAGESLARMRHLAALGEARLIQSVAYYPDAGELTAEQLAGALEGLAGARGEIVRQLLEGAERILVDMGELRRLMNGDLVERLRLAYAELNDFKAEGFAGGRWAWSALEELGGQIRQWAREMASCWEAAGDTLNLELRRTFDDVWQRCPMTPGLDEAIRARLLLEESRLLRDLGEQSRTTAPERDDTEAERMARLLRVYVSRVTDARLVTALGVVAEGGLTADEKLERLDRALPIPPNTSAATLGELLGVSKQAIANGQWWRENRRGERDEADEATGRRRACQEERAKLIERRESGDG